MSPSVSTSRPGWICAATALLLCWAAAPAPARQSRPGARDPQPYDPAALRLLDRMADAYAHLPALDQRTVFYSSLTPVPAANDAGAQDGKPLTPATTTAKASGELKNSFVLEYSAPNRLHMEMDTFDPGTSKRFASEWISDGKVFWTYLQDQQLYTMDKAPRRIEDFRKLAHLNTGSLELVMLMGINPFANVKSQVESVRMGAGISVHREAAQCVILEHASSTQTVKASLYIGASDYLLRRVVIETRPAPAPLTPGKVGDSLDALVDPASSSGGESPTGEQGNLPDHFGSGRILPVITTISYDSTIDLRPAFTPQTFSFAIPSTARLYQAPGSLRPPTLKEKQSTFITEYLKRIGHPMARKVRIIRY
ncbi:MAG TPA: DUF2092 domain-containing protein [Chthonomonadales bacterium]|nr:DUF2092 domain-containing protein [Chthonomonadales bacterium]